MIMKVCAMEPCLQAWPEPMTARSVGQPLTHWATSDPAEIGANRNEIMNHLTS